MLGEALSKILKFKDNVDYFTFEYVAGSKGTSEQNSALFETEIRIREGVKVFEVNGDQRETIDKYLKARNDYYGSNIRFGTYTTNVDTYSRDENGNWKKQ